MPGMKCFVQLGRAAQVSVQLQQQVKSQGVMSQHLLLPPADTAFVTTTVVAVSGPQPGSGTFLVLPDIHAII